MNENNAGRPKLDKHGLKLRGLLEARQQTQWLKRTHRNNFILIDYDCWRDEIYSEYYLENSEIDIPTRGGKRAVNHILIKVFKPLTMQQIADLVYETLEKEKWRLNRGL